MARGVVEYPLIVRNVEQHALQGFGVLSEQMQAVHKTQENLAQAMHQQHRSQQQDVDLMMKVHTHASFRPRIIVWFWAQVRAM